MTFRLAIALCSMVAFISSACGSSTSPSPPADVNPTCTLSTTMTFLSPSPSEGMPFTQYFAGLVVPAQGAVYFVDITTSPSGCVASWTAVPSNADTVNVSPYVGNGRGRVELFMPPNPDPARRTTVTIAGQVASILQAGR